jgi:hypothetical protein
MSRFHVVMEYMTRGGNPASVAYIIEAETCLEAHRLARRRLERDRRRRYMRACNARTTRITEGETQ